VRLLHQLAVLDGSEDLREDAGSGLHVCLFGRRWGVERSRVRVESSERIVKLRCCWMEITQEAAIRRGIYTPTKRSCFFLCI
jgi:hypothetical protein